MLLNGVCFLSLVVVCCDVVGVCGVLIFVLSVMCVVGGVLLWIICVFCRVDVGVFCRVDVGVFRRVDVGVFRRVDVVCWCLLCTQFQF